LLSFIVTTPIAKSPPSKNRVAGTAATVAAACALACGICCVLPFALPAAVLAVAGGALAWFGGIMPWMTIAAIISVAGAWIWVGYQSFKTKRRAALSTLITMGVATALLVAAVLWPRYEDFVVGLLRH
jgi:hypothetical protein